MQSTCLTTCSAALNCSLDMIWGKIRTCALPLAWLISYCRPACCTKSSSWAQVGSVSVSMPVSPAGESVACCFSVVLKALLMSVVRIIPPTVPGTPISSQSGSAFFFFLHRSCSLRWGCRTKLVLAGLWPCVCVGRLIKTRGLLGCWPFTRAAC